MRLALCWCRHCHTDQAITRSAGGTTPLWLGPTVIAIATGVCEDPAFDRLSVLADALEDAGCDNPGLLAHCRGEGPHVRGCWAVDLVLEKG